MDKINITAAQYVVDEDSNVSVRATIDGQEVWVPADPSNRHYAEIMRQVEAGTLAVQEAT